MTLAASSVLVVVLVLLLCREVRLRRSLQALLKRLLSFWRNTDAEDPVAQRGDPDDPAGDRVL